MAEQGNPAADGFDPVVDKSSLDRRRFLIGGLLAAGSATVFARTPRENVDVLGKRKLDNIIPKQIGPWRFLTTSGLVVPTEDTLSAALYSQLLTRVYTNGDEPPIMLLIAQSAGQSGILQIHRPEFCYPATGFALSSIDPIALPSGTGRFAANSLTATVPGRAEQIIYWTRVGSSMPLSWANQRLAVAMDNLKGIVPDAVLTRISTVDVNREAAMTRLAQFAEQMLAGLGPNRSVLTTS